MSVSDSKLSQPRPRHAALKPEPLSTASSWCDARTQYVQIYHLSASGGVIRTHQYVVPLGVDLEVLHKYPPLLWVTV